MAGYGPFFRGHERSGGRARRPPSSKSAEGASPAACSRYIEAHASEHTHRFRPARPQSRPPHARQWASSIATLDSFSTAAIISPSRPPPAAARLMVVDGADILDIGGESTRPGATPVDVDGRTRAGDARHRRRRPLSDGPPLLDRHLQAPGSRGRRWRRSRIVNDVTGLQRDPAIAAVAAEHDAVLVIGH